MGDSVLATNWPEVPWKAGRERGIPSSRGRCWMMLTEVLHVAIDELISMSIFAVFSKHASPGEMRVARS